jgi:hypothetical protein
MNNKIILATVISLGLSATAFADNQNGYYVGANFGGLIHSSGTTNGYTPSLTAGLQINPNSAFQITGMLGGHDNGFVMAEGLFMYPLSHFINPYLIVGAGYTHLSGNSIGGEIGAGMRFNLTPNLSLATNYRFIQALGSHTPTVGMLDAGVTYYFGGSNWRSSANQNYNNAIGDTSSNSNPPSMSPTDNRDNHNGWEEKGNPDLMHSNNDYNHPVAEPKHSNMNTSRNDVYTVEKGDTLYKIATTYNKRDNKVKFSNCVKEANHLESIDKIYTGTELNLSTC